MTKPLSPTAVDPMVPTMKGDVSDVLPGTSILGCGVDVYGQYCSGNSVKLPIIDLSDRDQSVEGTNLRTSARVRVLNDFQGMASEIEATTLTEASTKFNSAIGIKGSYGFFSGELKASYDTSFSHRSSTRYTQYNEQFFDRKLQLGSITELRDQMTDRAKSDFDGGMTPQELVAEYGTRFIRSLIIGARVSYSCTIDESQTVSGVDLSVATKLSYKSVVASAEATGSAQQQKAAKAISENAVRQARVLGGDPKLVHQILEGAYKDWRASTEKFKHVVDLFQGMHLISELITDPERRKKVEAAIVEADGRAALPALPNEVPVMSFHANNPSRWFYTIKPDERPSGYGGHGVPFRAFNEKLPGTVAIYRLRAANPDRFMLSADNTSRAGWSDAELAFYAYNGQAAGRKAIYSHYNSAKPGEAGWHYSDSVKVKGWTEDPSNRFFVPAN